MSFFDRENHGPDAIVEQALRRECGRHSLRACFIARKAVETVETVETEKTNHTATLPGYYYTVDTSDISLSARGRTGFERFAFRLLPSYSSLCFTAFVLRPPLSAPNPTIYRVQKDIWDMRLSKWRADHLKAKEAGMNPEGLVVHATMNTKCHKLYIHTAIEFGPRAWPRRHGQRL